MYKDSRGFIGNLKYFVSIVGSRFYVYILLNFFVGLFDSFGLAMFIPLISLISEPGLENDSLGKLAFLVDFIHYLGFELNLGIVLIFMISLFCIKGAFYYIKNIYLNETLLLAQKKVRFKMVDGLRDLTYEGYTKINAGKIQNTLVAETGKFMGAFNAYFVSIQNFVMLVTYIFLAFLSNWKFSIMVAIGALITNILYKYINRTTKKIALNLSNIGHDFNGKIIQTVHHYKYLKATGTFEIFEKKLKKDIEVSEKMNYRMHRITSIGEALREPLVITVIALVLYIQLEVLKNEFATILVSLMLFYRALSYLISMQSTFNSFLRASAGIVSIESLIDEFHSNKEKSTDVVNQNIGELRLENIKVQFDTKVILDSINFIIPKNYSVAFVGASGAGKTTLANVISGIQHPTEGNLWNNEIRVYDSQINSYRKKVGYITQEPVIFDDSLFNNITLWDEMTEENLLKFRDTISKVDLDEFYNKLELKEKTQLGNNGVLISGGQKQRISIARELYKNCELLIMDEATSALDSETERNIKESIDLLQGKFTLVIIAHRLSTIKNVDVIYLLNDGKIEDFGSYEELCHKSKKFRNMVEIQSI